MKVLPNLNPLRFFLASIVMLFHLPQFFKNRELPYFDNSPIFNKGTEAVYVFFVLSGYLIIRLLYIEKIKTSSINIRNFYMRRVLRIFPLYFFVLISGLFYYNYFLDLIGISFETNYNLVELLTLYIFFLPNVASNLYHPGGALEVLWSIGIEEQFYLFIAPLFLFLNKRYLIPFFSIFTVGYFLLIATNIFPFLSDFDFFYFYFSAGGVASILDIKYGLGKRFNQISKFLILILFIVFFTTDLIQFSIESYNHLFGLILFPLLVLTISNNPIFVIKSKIVNYLGKISYGIYMYHAFAINFIGFLALKMNSKFNISTAAMMVVSFVLVFLTTIAAAHLSFKFFEQKFIRLKKHFR